jgi:hypothetical protein
MRTTLARGIAVVSVCESGNIPQPVGELNAVKHLLDACDRLAIRATWAFAQPGHSPATKLLAGRHEQEVALVANHVGDDSSVQFTKNLLRGVVAGGAFGAPLSTLFVDRPPSPHLLEIMAKYGITAVCRTDVVRRGAAMPRRLRYNVDAFAPHATFPHGSCWFGSEVRQMDRLLRTASDQQQLVHFALDIVRIGSSNRRLAQADKILNTIGAFVQSGGLESATIRSAVDRLASCRSGRPAISILRRAA